MSRRDEIKKKLIEDLQFWGLQSRNAAGVAESIMEAIEAMTKKPKKAEGPTDGAKVWAAYADAYHFRYKVPPVRNATTNNQALQLTKRVGTDVAVELVRFYVHQADSFYLRNMHVIGLCLKDCEMLVTRMLSGKKISQKTAQKMETADSTITASANYLRRKYNNAVPPSEDK